MIGSTRLRFIAAKDLITLTNAVESLAFKVEIKGNPVRDKKGWVIFFILPEIDKFEWQSIDLREL